MGTWLCGNHQTRSEELSLQQEPLSIQGSLLPPDWSSPQALTSGTYCPSFELAIA